MLSTKSPTVVSATGKLSGGVTPRVKLTGLWRGWLFWQFSNNPNLNPGEISVLAQRLAEESGLNDPPKRTVCYKYYGEYKELAENVRHGFQVFQWPQAMHRGDLPWEASTDALRLLKWARINDLPPPTINVVSWFWRVSLIAPDASLKARLCVAMEATAYEEADRPFPDNLLDVLADKNIEGYLPTFLGDGGASEIWCRLAVQKAYEGALEYVPFFNALLSTRPLAAVK